MLVQIIIFVIVLSILVLVHELGHFFVAKKAGVWVEEFGFGLPPRAIGKKIGETIYSLNWLPFGGFVRLHGEETGEEIKDPKRAFSNQRKTTRALIVTAGVFMNFLLAWFIFSGKYLYNGVPETTNRNNVIGVVDNLPAKSAGIKEGDVITAVNGNKVSTVDQLNNQLDQTRGQETTLTIERSGQQQIVKLTPQPADRILVLGTVEGSPAQMSGLKAGDSIISANGKISKTVDDFRSIVNENLDKTISLDVEDSSGVVKTVDVTPKASQTTKGQVEIGILLASSNDKADFSTWTPFYSATEIDSTGLAVTNDNIVHTPFINYFFKSLYFGFREALYWIGIIWGGLVMLVGNLFQGHVPKGVTGPVGIFAMTSEAAKMGFETLANFVAIISINLAVLNIMPFPALDGGRLLFVILENFFGRKKLPRIEAMANMIGLAVLLTFILAITISDIRRLISAGSIEGFINSVLQQ